MVGICVILARVRPLKGSAREICFGKRSLFQDIVRLLWRHRRVETLVDNFAEAKRSAELPMYLAKTYESNLLINIAEYVNIIDQSTFMENEQPIRAVLEDISKGYLFNDVGFIKKNYCNWGCRTTSAGDSLVILDYGYMYPLIGQNLEELFKCPVCGGRLKWNGTYSKLVCSGNKKNVGYGGRCMCTVEPNEIRRRMNRRLDSYENKLIASLSGSSMPDLDTIEQALHEEVDI